MRKPIAIVDQSVQKRSCITALPTRKENCHTPKNSSKHMIKALSTLSSSSHRESCPARGCSPPHDSRSGPTQSSPSHRSSRCRLHARFPCASFRRKHALTPENVLYLDNEVGASPIYQSILFVNPSIHPSCTYISIFLSTYPSCARVKNYHGQFIHVFSHSVTTIVV